MRVQFGGEPKSFKPMPSVGAGAYEIRVRDESGGACEGPLQIDWR
jgi:hypothetical protein